MLDVGNLNSGNICLVETKGRRGNFCALSYCWGPKGTPAMATTRDNLNDQLKGIPLASLPKTFRDAIVVTREVGIRYLWIDALCIIQGDEKDWKTECARMAGVYQGASLVIAASGAENPEEGCFSRKHRCSAVDVPYYSTGGQRAGLMQLSARADDESPYWGPLNTRGWAVQEWYLGRRVLHFMPGGLSWKCRVVESGERYPYDMQQSTHTWERILQEFSKRRLTCKEDRLMAVEGLAQATHDVSSDGYRFGVFESKIPEQLLWAKFHAERSEDLEDMPSWSWASQGGRKVFWTTQFDEWLPPHYAQIAFEPSGILKIDSFLAESSISAEACEGDNASEAVFSALLSSIRRLRRNPLHWIQSLSDPLRFTGIAAFDGEPFRSIHILFLLRLSDYD